MSGLNLNSEHPVPCLLYPYYIFDLEVYNNNNSNSNSGIEESVIESTLSILMECIVHFYWQLRNVILKSRWRIVILYPSYSIRRMRLERYEGRHDCLIHSRKEIYKTRAHNYSGFVSYAYLRLFHLQRYVYMQR